MFQVKKIINHPNYEPNRVSNVTIIHITLHFLCFVSFLRGDFKQAVKLKSRIMKDGGADVEKLILCCLRGFITDRQTHHQQTFMSTKTLKSSHV